MSNRPDTPPEEYARGTMPVSRAYRALPDDGPPPGLDAAILAKARAAIGERPASELQQRRWRRIAVPVALAASVVMAIGVVLEVNKQPQPMQSPEQTSAPANRKQEVSNSPTTVIVVPLNSVTSAPPEVAVQVAPAPEPSAPRAEADTPQQRRERVAESIDQRLNRPMAMAAAAPPPVAAGSPAALTGNLVVASPELRQQRANQYAAAADSASMAKAIGTATAERSAQSEQVQRDPAQWLSAIQALRKAGDAPAADREWLVFRKAWPNYPVPADGPSSQGSESK
jgi:hypothetical protein